MRVLFLTHRLPYAPDRGDRLRARAILEHLRPHAAVDLVSLVHDRREQAQVGALSDLCDRVAVCRVPWLWTRFRGALGLLEKRPLTHFLLHSPRVVGAVRQFMESRRPDVVLAFCSSMARYAMLPPLASLPWVLDMVDVDSEKWRALGRTTPPPMRWIYRREAKTLRAFEARAAKSAYASVVVTEGERESLSAIAPGARVEVVPNGVDLARFLPAAAPQELPRVVFCGVLDYAPNEQGVSWFLEAVWPQVLRRIPAARFQIVGRNPTGRLRRMAERRSGVELVGEVEDVAPWLWGAALAVAPLRIARGVQNKVLEAVAAGLPCVVTPVVARGVPEAAIPACRIGSDADMFARRVVDLLERSPAERRAIAAHADLRALRWEHTLARLVPLLHEAITHGRRPLVG